MKTNIAVSYEFILMSSSNCAILIVIVSNLLFSSHRIKLMVQFRMLNPLALQVQVSVLQQQTTTIQIGRIMTHFLLPSMASLVINWKM